MPFKDLPNKQQQSFLCCLEFFVLFKHISPAIQIQIISTSSHDVHLSSISTDLGSNTCWKTIGAVSVINYHSIQLYSVIVCVFHLDQQLELKIHWTGRLSWRDFSWFFWIFSASSGEVFTQFCSSFRFFSWFSSRPFTGYLLIFLFPGVDNLLVNLRLTADQWLLKY